MKYKNIMLPPSRRIERIHLLQIVALLFFIILIFTGLWKQIVQNRYIFVSNPHPQVPAKRPSHVDHGQGYENVGMNSVNIKMVDDYKIRKRPSKKKYAFTIVTGASKNHFCPIKGFVYNLKNTLKGLNVRTIIYDLGLKDIQRKEMKDLMYDGYFDELHVFDFSAYPSFWNISEARGEYAWKPGIMSEVSKRYPGIIIWLDSGTLPERKFFKKLTFLLRMNGGFFSPRSSGLMGNWTHPGVYDYYDDDSTRYDALPNCNGAAIAFNTKKTQHIIDEWYSCALNKDCIAPVGSNRKNHRQDQAVLTYLVAREEHYCVVEKELVWVHTHEDRNCKKIIAFYEKSNINH